MTANEISTKYSPEKLTDFGFQPIGVIELGDTTFLLKKDKGILFAFEPVDPINQRDYFRKQTERLNQKNYIKIPDVDAVQVTYLQLNSKETLSVNWNETTSGADKPEINIPVTDAIFFDDSVLELNEEVLKDLFLPKDNASKQATFFTMETADLEIIGIAIRGRNPKLLLLPPAPEGSKLSTIEGFDNFLDSVYLALKGRTTQIQKQVDDKIFEASLPTNRQLVFSAESTKKSLAAVHQKIYQIQGLLLSLRSDERLGTQAPELLAHAPFLKTEVKQNGISALLNRNQKPTSLVVDSSIWTNLNMEPGRGLIVTGPKSQRPVRIHQNSVAAPVTPTVVNRIDSTPARVENRPVATTEKQKALQLASGIEAGLSANLIHFKDYPLDQLGLKQVIEFGETLAKVHVAAEKYIAERRRGKEPARPTPTRISSDRSVNIAGLRGEAVFAFLTGNQTVTDYKAKIEAGLSAIKNMAMPLIAATDSRKERLLSNVKNTSHLRRIAGVENLIPELEKLASAVNSSDVFTSESVYMIIAAQINYVLWARFQELKSQGTEVEIDNWANYCYGVTDTLITLAQEMVTK